MRFMSPETSHSKEPKKASYEKFIEKENICPLCGIQLYVVVELSLKDSSLKEEAHCSNCCIRTRKRNHKMH